MQPCVPGRHCRPPCVHAANPCVPPPPTRQLGNVGAATTLQPQQAQQPAARQYRFPSQLVEMLLTTDQRSERYGVEQDEVPSQLQREMDLYHTHTTQPINLDRGQRYARPVQEATATSTAKAIRGFMGYTNAYCGVQLHNLSLSSYADPEFIMSFVSYLKERGCGRGQILKHVSEMACESLEVLGCGWGLMPCP